MSLVYFSEANLLNRLDYAHSQNQKVIFVVGSPLTAGSKATKQGVLNVTGVIELIRREFRSQPAAAQELEDLLRKSSNAYQDAFVFLFGNRGIKRVNEIVREAVLHAWIGGPIGPSISDDDYQGLEKRVESWVLQPGLASLGNILTQNRSTFGGVILTTNFDPLIEVAIKKSNGQYFQSVLDCDGDLSRVRSDGCHVVHLHGYWYGTDTLHTPNQLTQPRKQLKNSLSSLIANSLVVIVAYGGWDDVITQSLVEISENTSASPEVIWTFFSDSERDISEKNKALLEKLQPGIRRERVSLFKGINCNEFFPKLEAELKCIKKVDQEQLAKVAPEVIAVSDAIQKSIDQIKVGLADRPETDVFIGRHECLGALRQSVAKVFCISGMGGQGKSALASYFLANTIYHPRAFQSLVWQDCREHANTLHTALVKVVETLSRGSLTSDDFVDVPVESVIKRLMDLLTEQSALVVFDNVDHYIDLENGKPLLALAHLMDRALNGLHRSTLIFTSRPAMRSESPAFHGLVLTGLSKDAAKELFELRLGTSITRDLSDRIHSVTQGHPLWIGLIAGQARVNPSRIAQILDDIESGTGDLPENTLMSVWNQLIPRQKELLRILSEIVRPEREEEVFEITGWTFAKTAKTIKQLDSLNLLLKTKSPDSHISLDIHPLIRTYIKTHFAKVERDAFIIRIIKFIDKKLSKNNSVSFSEAILERWAEKIELLVNKAAYEEALIALAELHGQFECHGMSGEIVRLSSRALDGVDWVKGVASVVGFDTAVQRALRSIVEAGNVEQVDMYLAKYEKALPGKGAQYVNYCDVKSFRYWFVGSYEQAIHWANLGIQLKKSANADIQYDCSYELALAQRDNGDISPALDYWLAGTKLEELLSDKDPRSDRNGPFYGNIGRCLYLQKDFDGAMNLYKKSAKRLEASSESMTLNGGWVRYWVGQCLLALGHLEDAYVFYLAANLKWKKLVPKSIKTLDAEVGEMRSRLSNWKEFDSWPDWKVENRFLEWLRSS